VPCAPLAASKHVIKVSDLENGGGFLECFIFFL
jgi:hypothetical protein